MYVTRIRGLGHAVSFLPALVSIKFLAVIFLLLFSASAVGQVIDFSNVNPDQGTGHGGPITATGADGVQVTVEFINIETSDAVTSGLYSARDCTGTSFEGVFLRETPQAGVLQVIWMTIKVQYA